MSSAPESVTYVLVVAGALSLWSGARAPAERAAGIDVSATVLDARTSVPASDSLVSRALGSAEIIDRPWMIGLVGDLVVVTDLDPPHIHLFDRGTGQHLKSFGAAGEGPGEFSNGPSLLRAGLLRDTMWLLDGPRRRLTGYAVGSLVRANPSAGARIVNLPALMLQSIDGPDAEGLFFATSDDPRDGMRLMHLSGQSGAVVKSVPIDVGDLRPSPEYVPRAYSHRACLQGDVKGLYLVYRYAGRIDRISAETDQVQGVAVPFRWLPFVSPDTINPKLVTFGGSRPLVRRAYSDCYVTADRFYAMYSGRLRGEQQNPSPRAEVHVFDLAGHLQRVVVLDHASNVFVVTPDNGTLYSIAEESGGWVIRVSTLGNAGGTARR